MGKAINCILSDDLHSKVLKFKVQMQKESDANITLTDAVEELLWRGLVH